MWNVETVYLLEYLARKTRSNIDDLLHKMILINLYLFVSIKALSGQGDLKKMIMPSHGG